MPHIMDEYTILPFQAKYGTKQKEAASRRRISCEPFSRKPL
jgi:hypothetical protein